MVSFTCARARSFTFQEAALHTDAGSHVLWYLQRIGDYSENCRRTCCSPGINSIENDSCAMRMLSGMHHCPVNSENQKLYLHSTLIMRKRKRIPILPKIKPQIDANDIQPEKR